MEVRIDVDLMRLDPATGDLIVTEYGSAAKVVLSPEPRLAAVLMAAWQLHRDGFDVLAMLDQAEDEQRRQSEAA